MKHLKRFNENNWFMNPGNPFSPISPLNPNHPLYPEIMGKKEESEPTQPEKWAIYAGLGGGFGGGQFKEVFTGTKQQAESHAYQLAVEEYESYEGLHGLRTTDEIMDEDGVDEDEAEEIYNEEKEGWLDYWVEPYNSSKDYE